MSRKSHYSKNQDTATKSNDTCIIHEWVEVIEQQCKTLPQHELANTVKKQQ